MSSIGNMLACTGKNQRLVTKSPYWIPVPEFHQEIEILTKESADNNLGSPDAVVDSSQNCIGQDEQPVNKNSKSKQEENNNNTQLPCEFMSLQVSNRKLTHVSQNQQTILQQQILEAHQEIEILPKARDSRSSIKSTSTAKIDMQHRLSVTLPETNVDPNPFNKLDSTFDTQLISETQLEVENLPRASEPTNLIEDSLSNVIIIETKGQGKSISIKCLHPDCSTDDDNKSSGLKDNPQYDCHIDWLKLLEWQTRKKKFSCALCDERFERQDDLKVHVQKHIDFDQNRPMNENNDSDSDSIIEILPENQSSLQDSVLQTPRCEISPTLDNQDDLDDQISVSDSVIEILPEKNVNHTKNCVIYENQSSLQDSISLLPDCQISDCNLVKETSVEKNVNHNVNDLSGEILPSVQDLVSPTLDSQISDSDSVIEILPEDNDNSTSCSSTEQTQFTNENLKHCPSNISETHSDMQLAHSVNDSILQRYLASQSDTKVLICAHCDERFERKDNLTEHVQRHMNLDLRRTENDNVDGQISKRYQEKAILAEVNTDNVVNSSICAIGPFVQDSALPPLHFEVSECNPAIGASAEMETDHSGCSLNHKTNHLPAKRRQVTLRDILAPLFSKSQRYSGHPSRSKTSSTCKTPLASRANWSADGSNKIRGPNGKLIYACHITGCGKFFGYPHVLRRHLNVHSGKKNLVCVYCPRRFARKDYLSRHMQKHEKDVFCMHCDERFTSKCQLKVHVKGHTSVKPIDCQPQNSSGRNAIRDFNGRPLHLCRVSNRGKFSYVKVKKRNLQWHKGKTKFTCKQCDETFLRKDHLSDHIQKHMNFNQTGPENDNASSQVSKCFKETDTLAELRPNNIDNSLNYNMQSSVEDLLPPPLDIKISKYNSVTEALIEESTDYNEDSLDYIGNCSSIEQSRVSIRDLLIPLLPNSQLHRSVSSTSKNSSTSETRYYAQDLLQSMQSPTDSINDMQINREKLNNFMSTSYSVDHTRANKKQIKRRDNKRIGSSRHVCPIPNCGKIYKHARHFNFHLDWHNGKHRFFCADCGKGFVRKDALCFHVVTHMPGLKKRRKSQCSKWRAKSDNRKYRLKNQMRRHESQKIFVCPLCKLTFLNEDKLTEHMEMHKIGKQNEFKNRSFDFGIPQGLSMPEAEPQSAEYTTDIMNCETQLSLQDLIPTSLNNYISGCYSIIRESPEVKTENFVDSLTNMASFSSLEQNQLAEDAPLICKTEYFVQESMSSSLNNKVLDCYSKMESLPEVKAENFVDNVGMTSFSSLVRNPFHRQFLPSRKNKVRPSKAKDSLLISKTEYSEQESMPPSLNGQVSDFYRMTDRSPVVKTENFVDSVSRTSSFEQNQLNRQSSLPTPPCEWEVHLSHPDEPFSKSNSATCEIQCHMENLVPPNGQVCVPDCNPSTETSSETNVEINVDDKTCPMSAFSMKRDTREQMTPLKESNSASNTSFICKTQSEEPDLLTLSEPVHLTKYTPGVDNKLIPKHSSNKLQHACHIPNCGRIYNKVWHLKRHLNWHRGKKIFFCTHCNKGFVHKNVLRIHINKVHLSDSHTNVKRSEANNDNLKSQVSQILSIPKLQVPQEQEQTTPVDNSSAEVANKTIVSNINPENAHHKNIPKNRRLFVCYYQSCDKIFDSAYNLQRHLNEHNGQKNWLCMYCDKKFLYKYELKSHVKTHLTVSENCDIEYGPSNDQIAQHSQSSYERPYEDDYGKDKFAPCNSSISEPVRMSSIDKDLRAVLCSTQFCSNGDHCNCWKPDDNNTATQLYCNAMPAEVSNEELDYPSTKLCVTSQHKVSDVYQKAENPTKVSVKNDLDSDDCLGEDHRLSDQSFCCKLGDINNRTIQLYPESTPLKASNEELEHDSSNLGTTAKHRIPDRYQELEISAEADTDHTVDRLISMENISSVEEIEFDIKYPLTQDLTNKRLSLPNEPHSSTNTSSTCETHTNFSCAPLKKKFAYEHLLKTSQSLSISKSQMAQERMQTKCQYPNCSAEGGNKTKCSITGKPQHVRYIPKCGRVFNHIGHLKEHLAWHSGKKNFVCPHCRKEFGREVDLKSHLQVHMPKPTTQQKCQCPNCSAEGGNQIRGPNGKLQHVCHYPDCGKVYCETWNLKRHILMGHSREKNFFCAYCNKSFVFKHQVRQHAETHMDTKKKLQMSKDLESSECHCPNCSAEGGNKSTGSGDRPLHNCHFIDCGSAYVDSTSLARHLGTHNGKRIFVCPYCAKRFARQNTFMAHIKVHRLPVSQDLSVPQLRMPQTLEQKACQCSNYRQLNDNSGEFQHTCPEPDCGKVYGKASSLRMHLNWHVKKHTGPKYFCAHCNRGFYFERRLRAHVEVHRNSVDSRVSQGLSAPKMEASQESKLTECQSPNSWAEDGNQTKGLNDRPRYVCHIPGCERVYEHAGHFKAHLNRHAKEYTGVKKSRPKNSVDGPILQNYCSLIPKVKAEIQSDDVKPQHFCTTAGCDKIYFSAKDLNVHLRSHLSDHTYSLTRHSQSHISNKDSSNSECQDQCGSTKSYLLDHQYTRDEE